MQGLGLQALYLTRVPRTKPESTCRKPAAGGLPAAVTVAWRPERRPAGGHRQAAAMTQNKGLSPEKMDTVSGGDTRGECAFGEVLRRKSDGRGL